MTTLPDLAVPSVTAARLAGEAESLVGQREVEEFERLKDAYDPRMPETGVQMVSAFLKFHQLGYAAYFQGVVGVPPMIAARPRLASLWLDGYGLAECDAATRRCNCACDKRFGWEKGYGTCPRMPQRSQSKY